MRIITKKVPVKFNIKASLNSLTEQAMVAFKMTMHDVLEETKDAVRRGMLVDSVGATMPRNLKWTPTAEYVKRYFGNFVVIGGKKDRRAMAQEIKKILLNNMPDRSGEPALFYTGQYLHKWRVMNGLTVQGDKIGGQFFNNSEYAITHDQGIGELFKDRQYQEWREQYHVRVLSKGFTPKARKIFKTETDETRNMFTKHFIKNFKAIAGS